MARDVKSGGATMFLLSTDAPGFSIVGHTRTIDNTMLGGHSQVRFDDAFVPAADVLGEPGEACAMRRCDWHRPGSRTACDGSVPRAAHMRSRSADRCNASCSVTGSPTSVWRNNSSPTTRSTSRPPVRCSGTRLGSTQAARRARSRRLAKVHISEAVSRIVDRSVQLAGGLGTSEELVIGRIYADVRAFRIYDGASEVHRMSIAKRAARRALTAQSSDPTA